MLEPTSHMYTDEYIYLVALNKNIKGHTNKKYQIIIIIINQNIIKKYEDNVNCARMGEKISPKSPVPSNGKSLLMNIRMSSLFMVFGCLLESKILREFKYCHRIYLKILKCLLMQRGFCLTKNFQHIFTEKLLECFHFHAGNVLNYIDASASST